MASTQSVNGGNPHKTTNEKVSNQKNNTSDGIPARDAGSSATDTVSISTETKYLNLVKKNPLSLKDCPPEIRNNWIIVYTAVGLNPKAYLYASPELQNESCLQLMAFQYCSERVRNDRELALKAIAEDPSSILYVGKDLLNSEGFLSDAFYADPESLRILSKAKPEYANVYNRIKVDMTNKYGFTRFDRFGHLGRFLVEGEDTSVFKEICQNRENIRQRDPRPIAVIIVAKYDWNNAFTNQGTARKLMGSGYRVLYFEAGTDGEIIDAIRESSTNTKISVLIIGGHGKREAVYLTGGSNNENNYLDVYHDRNKLADVDNCLTDGAVIILDSCSTGDGGESEDNVMNLIYYSLTGFTKKKMTVYAPSTDSYDIYLMFNNNNEIYWVEYPDYDDDAKKSDSKQKEKLHTEVKTSTPYTRESK